MRLDHRKRLGQRNSVDLRKSADQRKRFGLGLSSCVVLSVVAADMTAPVARAQALPPSNTRDRVTLTPIKHVIIILGENRSFDHVFATYVPTRAGETVWNLLSKGIVKADGTPGPNYPNATQYSAIDNTTYQVAPSSKTPYTYLPPPQLPGPQIGPGTPPFTTIAQAMAAENGLPNDYYVYLTTGQINLPPGPDTRITYNGQDVSHLPPGPFQITSATLPYDSYMQSPVHRLYQMWQQHDCSVAHQTAANPSGCLADLFPWVEVSVGQGSDGKPQPPNFDNASTGEGGVSMGFYNVQQGDAPYLKSLADSYSMSDNYHQAVMGGTGANHIMFGTGDMLWFSDGNGNPTMPPHNQFVNNAGPSNAGVVDEIENPNPQAGTNNFYTEDGYGGGSHGSPSFGGGSYSACGDITQPGVGPLTSYLTSLRRPIQPNCAAGHYYLVNNYNPGYFGNGSNAYNGPAANFIFNTVFTVPPSSVRTIGDLLNESKISWAYYGDQFNVYLTDPYQLKYLDGTDQYCTICNWAAYATSIMTNPAVRTAHLKDTSDLYAAIANGTLPAVSYVKPSALVDGHPASSKLDLFEGFAKKIVDLVRSNNALWAETAVLVTFDEGGGLYDSGYVQPLDFFGDGTRTVMIAVSPFSTPGHISHTYSDHVSTLKFIERNWLLPPLTYRSRDRLPNPVTQQPYVVPNPYVPLNSPAIGDLMDLFDFTRSASSK